MVRGNRGFVLAAVLVAALMFAAAAAAQRVTTSQIPLTAVLLSPCTGDVITFTGTAVLTVTEDDTLRVRLSGDVRDPRAQGVLYSYNFKDQLSSADVVRLADSYKATFTDRLHFIRLGSGGDQKSDDLFVTLTIYATIDSNLMLKADRIDYQVECR